MSGSHILYIIGFMGSGKTTAGRRLASSLRWSFIDLDRRIEEYLNMTIAEVFSQYGENYFREIESRLLRDLAPASDIVVATGGGAPCYGNNMEFMLDSGLTIYLKLTPSQLASRLSSSSDERPLIRNLTGENLLKFIEGKLAEREKWYEKSHFVVNGFDPDIYSVRTQVISHFERLK